jgi:hypothetical protein
VKRLGWIVIEWTGRDWIPNHDTAARTREEALHSWLRRFGPGKHKRRWRECREAGRVEAVRTYIDDEPGRHGDGSLL